MEEISKMDFLFFDWLNELRNGSDVFKEKRERERERKKISKE